MNIELNQTVGLVERNQSKFLGVLVQQHMSIMLYTQIQNPTVVFGECDEILVLAKYDNNQTVRL